MEGNKWQVFSTSWWILMARFCEAILREGAKKREEWEVFVDPNWAIWRPRNSIKSPPLFCRSTEKLSWTHHFRYWKKNITDFSMLCLCKTTQGFCGWQSQVTRRQEVSHGKIGSDGIFLGGNVLMQCRFSGCIMLYMHTTYTVCTMIYVCYLSSVCVKCGSTKMNIFFSWKVWGFFFQQRILILHPKIQDHNWPVFSMEWKHQVNMGFLFPHFLVKMSFFAMHRKT